MKFSEIGLHDQVLEAISYMNFEECTEVQEQAIPSILKGEDLIACAQTGTGKTAAFMLPVLDMLANDNKEGTRALVLVPTRELALQIDQQINGFSYYLSLQSVAIYGGGDGRSHDEQKKALESGVDIVVATPGKLISFLNMGNAKFEDLQYLIMDEADRMLDIGFYDDIMKIVDHLPKKRQNLMFSATMPPKIRSLSKKLLIDPKEISIAISKPAEGVLQAAYCVYDNQKIPLLLSLIKGKENLDSVIIFVSTKAKVAEVYRQFKKEKLQAASISSDLDQSEREAVMNKFKARRIQILVATDVISRGIDIKDINMVVNYDVPDDAEDYVHRVGRTARAATTGLAITLVNKEDMHKMKRIEDLIEREVYKAPLPTELGDGPDYDPNAKSSRGKFRRRR